MFIATHTHRIEGALMKLGKRYIFIDRKSQNIILYTLKIIIN